MQSLKKIKILNPTAKLSLIILVSILLNGCATSFSNRGLKNKLKKINSIELLEGKYNYYPIRDYSKHKKSSLKSVNVYNLINNIFSNSTKVSLNPLDKIEIKRNNSDQILQILVIDENTITVRHLIDDKIIAANEIDGELKNDGFFYLNNRFKKTKGIPYLWGGKTTSKGRIGLTNDNNLIFNGVYSNGGAILFLIANGSTHNSSYEIERLKK